MTPAGYLRQCRLAAGMSINDVALGLDTEPYRVSVVVRAEWLAAIEDGIVDLTLSTALALEKLPQLAFNLAELAALTDGPMRFRFIPAPTLDDQS